MSRSKGSVVANAGAIYPVDIDTGKIIKKRAYGLEMKYTHDPNSTINMKELGILEWEKLLKVMNKAAIFLPQNKMVAWDVTINNKDVIVINEGYMTPNPTLMQLEGIGKKI